MTLEIVEGEHWLQNPIYSKGVIKDLYHYRSLYTEQQKRRALGLAGGANDIGYVGASN